MTAPLLGTSGAATVFGPQKGASADQVQQLEAALTRYAKLLGGDPDTPGSGAAGGTAFGLIAAWAATVEPGADWIAKATGLPQAIDAADVVITGEGRFDSTSLTGKVVGSVIRLAGAARSGVVAGSVTSEPPAGVWAVGLADLAASVDAALAEPERWLRRPAAVPRTTSVTRIPELPVSAGQWRETLAETGSSRRREGQSASPECASRKA